MEEKEKTNGLPENAYRELKEGEEYRPLMPADKTYREVVRLLGLGDGRGVQCCSRLPRVEGRAGV